MSHKERKRAEKGEQEGKKMPLEKRYRGTDRRQIDGNKERQKIRR